MGPPSKEAYSRAKKPGPACSRQHGGAAKLSTSSGGSGEPSIRRVGLGFQALEVTTRERLPKHRKKAQNGRCRMTALRWIDTSLPFKWICVLPDRYTADELLDEFGKAMDELRKLPADRRLVVLTDLTKVTGSDSRRRQRIAQFMSENSSLIKEHVMAWGFVAHGVLRGALTALSWSRAFPVPMSVFGSRPACDAWLNSHLTAQGHRP
jgi:hypothetical protein